MMGWIIAGYGSAYAIKQHKAGRKQASSRLGGELENKISKFRFCGLGPLSE